MIAGYGIDAWHTALTVLGFNVGIELMQIAVVMATVPWLLWLAAGRTYRPIRIGGTAVAAIVAIIWIGERSSGIITVPTPGGQSTISGIPESAPHHWRRALRKWIARSPGSSRNPAND